MNFINGFTSIFTLFQRKISLFGLVIVALFLTSCSALEEKIPQSPILDALEPKFGLIAYIDIDGNVKVVDQVGKTAFTLTDDAQLPSEDSESHLEYKQLSFSKDGQNLAFVGINRESLGSSTSVLYTASLATGDVLPAFRSQVETPIYVYWSPDNNRVSFLASSLQTPGLILQSIQLEGGAGQVLGRGMPYFWSWSPNGEKIVLHAGRQGVNAVTERLALIDFTKGNVVEKVLEHQPVGFPAPSWFPDGEQIIVVAATDDNKADLLILDKNGETVKSLMTFDHGLVMFGISPDGTKLAYINGDPGRNGHAQGKLTVVDLENPERQIHTEEENTTAFFWAPDSSKLVYFGYGFFGLPIGESGTGDSDSSLNVPVVQVTGLDVNSEESYEILDYIQATDEFMDMVRFFDQYQHSATIWSPDSKNLVLSVQPFATEKPEIWVIDASGDLQPSKIANGVMALWSWK